MNCRSLLALCVVSAVAVAQQPARSKYLEPSQIIKRLEASPIEFEVKGLDELTDVARGKLLEQWYPQGAPAFDMPKVDVVKGTRRVTSWNVKPGVREPNEKAEKFFAAKNYVEARAWYEQALKADPNDYVLHAWIGDTFLFGETPDAKTALASYEQAIALNPYDSRLYFFRGNTRRHLSDFEGMAADFRTALMLRPRAPTLTRVLEKSNALEADLFVPRAFARWEEKKVVVYVDAERPEWLAWGMCKAMWLADEEHRKELTGSTKPAFTTAEEIECLNSLLSVYLSRQKDNEGSRDDRLERLLSITDDGLASAFIAYELGSRVNPHVTLTLEDAQRKLIETYVGKYVLKPAKP